jgi:uncharacterized iron-regulated membrane protein
MVALLLVLVMTAFFGLSVLFVKACERIVGPDVETTRADAATATSDREIAA